MKIAVDARSLGTSPGGIGMYLYDYVKAMKDIKGVEFILMTDLAQSEYIKRCISWGVRVETFGKKIGRCEVFKYCSFMQRVLDAERPDFFWEVNNLIPGRLKGDFKTVVTIHDMFPITHAKYGMRLYGIYFRIFVKKTIKKTDLILYNSKQTKKITERIFPEARFKQNKVTYLIPDNTESEVKLDDKGYFLYLGNLEERKGIDILLKAFLIYEKRGGEKKLILAGNLRDASTGAALKYTIERTERVKYLSYVSDKKKEELFRRCSCFVFPSRAEGYGMPVIEAMKAQKPVIASDLSIFKEIAGDEINTFALSADTKKSAEALAEEMFKYNPKPDLEKYKKQLSRYLPEKLGNKLYEFLAGEENGNCR